MSSQQLETFVVVGRIARPFGVQGWNHLTSFTDPPANILNYRPWAISRTSQDASDWLAIQDFRSQTRGNGLVVQLEGSTSRDIASRFVNRFIGTLRSTFPGVEADEHYCVDLIGTKVTSTDGKALGFISRISSNGAHEVLHVCDAESRDLLIPFIPSVLSSVKPGDEVQVHWQRDWS